jgi:hypothetical protein
MDYTYRSYLELLDHVRRCGHRICRFCDLPVEGRFVILRHDIDYSVIKAREMAEIEHRAGVHSTIFLLLSSPYYNLLTDANLRAVRDIIAMGHEIGFHFDTDLVADLPLPDRGPEIARQARLLGSMLGVEVTAVAQHNPSLTPVRVRVDGFVDAYDDQYFKNIAYVSDSRRLFGTPDLREFFRVHDRAQLLIHPLWWHEREKTRWESFRAIAEAIDADVMQRLTETNTAMEADERRLRAR